MATKEAYQKKLEAQLKEWDAKLDLLSAKAQKATADARIKYENDLESLKRDRSPILYVPRHSRSGHEGQRSSFGRDSGALAGTRRPATDW